MAVALERIYGAVSEPSARDACFETLCEATGCMGAVFRSFDHPSNAICTRSLADATLAYARKWRQQDILMATASARKPESGIVVDSDIEEVDRSSHPFFQKFLRARGLGSFAAYFSEPIFNARFVLIAQRGLLAGPFDPAQLAAMAQLAPHVTRALATAGQVAIGRSKDHALLAILGKLTYGAMIVGRSGKVTALNDPATAMLDDGLTLSDGILIETFSNPRGTLERMIKLAFADLDPPQVGSALIHRPSGRKPIALQTLPLPQTFAAASEAVQPADSILLLMIDTETTNASGDLSLVQALGLTLAEAKVAALVGSGLSPIETAEQLGSAAGTVRVQLKNVFNKLDIKRQSELVRLMTKLEMLGT